MAKSKLQILTPKHLRIVCECGGFMHEIRRGEDGEIEFDSFVLNKATPQEPPKEQPKKKKTGFGFFDDEETDGA